MMIVREGVGSGCTPEIEPVGYVEGGTNVKIGRLKVDERPVTLD